jgi:hypothetical protein
MNQDLIQRAKELELAKHLADSLDLGSWTSASLEERDRFLELARAALAWGVPVPVEQQPRYQEGYRAGWEAALKAAARAVRKVLPQNAEAA